MFGHELYSNRQVFPRRPVLGDGVRGRAGGSVELHDGQDPQGSAVPGARRVHEHGGSRAQPGLRERLRHVGGRSQRWPRQGVEGRQRTGAAQVGASPRQGSHVSAVRQRQYSDTVRLLRPNHQVPARQAIFKLFRSFNIIIMNVHDFQDPRIEVGKDFKRISRSYVVRERGCVHPGWTQRAKRFLRRHGQGEALTVLRQGAAGSGRQWPRTAGPFLLIGLLAGVVGAVRGVYGDVEAAGVWGAACQLAAADAQEPGSLRGV